MRIRRALLSVAMRVPPPLGPWLIGALIGRRPLYQGREQGGDARADIVRRCCGLTPSQRVVFMPALLHEAFERSDVTPYDLRRELDDIYARQFEMRELPNGGIEVRRAE